ncbi:MAG TPA: substrate-binding domain-containing protein, partial [Planctomicrobium sp.]|nr:substrate-binding domain-containing protein [Planctomicrobium sp.]
MARKTKRTCTEAHHIGLAIVQNFAYYRSALRGIRRFIESRPQWSVTSLTPTPEALQGRSRHRPEGVIASVTSVPMGQALANWKRPVVNISAALPSPQFHWVNVNNTEIGQLAVDHFLELGLRRFAYVGSPDHLFSTQREQAFRQAAQRTGHEVNLYKVDPSKWVPLLDSSGGPDPAFGQQWDLDSALARWLRQLPKPIGIFVPLDSWGVQVAEACRRAEVRIPEEVA